MATFEELKVPKSVVDKIRAAAQEDEKLSAITTPDGLKQWMADGNELSNAVSGIGDATENKVREVLGVDLKDVELKGSQSGEGEPDKLDGEAEQPSSEDPTASGVADTSESKQVTEGDGEVAAKSGEQGNSDTKLPTDDGDSNEATQTAIKDLPPPDRNDEEPPKQEPRFVDVTIRIPVGAFPSGREVAYADGGKVQLGRLAKKTQLKLTPELAKAFLCVREGLLANNDRLDSGQPVVSNADVVRWLMGPVAEAIAADPESVA